MEACNKDYYYYIIIIIIISSRCEKIVLFVNVL